MTWASRWTLVTARKSHMQYSDLFPFRQLQDVRSRVNQLTTRLRTSQRYQRHADVLMALSPSW